MSTNQAIEYGANSIHILEGLEAVRKRPGMYIGSTSTRGLNHLIYEIMDNSVDEHLAGYCSSIWITLKKDGACVVKDNGRGIPVDMHEKAYLQSEWFLLRSMPVENLIIKPTKHQEDYMELDPQSLMLYLKI